MNQEEFQNKLEEFRIELINSDEYKTLKECDKALYEDTSLRPLIIRKRELETQISIEYMNNDEKYKNLLHDYGELLKEISSNPSVEKYDEAFKAIKEIKEVFEKNLLLKLL